MLERAAAVFFIEDQAGSRSLGRVLFEDLHTAIGGTVVHEYQLEILEFLIENGVEAFPKKIFVLVIGHDHRNQGSLHR